MVRSGESVVTSSVQASTDDLSLDVMFRISKEEWVTRQAREVRVQRVGRCESGLTRGRRFG